MSFNPSSPRALGLEILPSAKGRIPLTTDADAVGMVVRSSVGETIDQLRLGHTWDLAGQYRKLAVDVYHLGDEGTADSETVSSYVPAGMVTSGRWSGWINGVSIGYTNLHTYIDDVGSSVDDNDEIRHLATAVAGTPPTPTEVFNPVVFQFGTAAFATTRRPLALTLRIRAKWDYKSATALGQFFSSMLTLRRLGVDVGNFTGAKWLPVGQYAPLGYQFLTYTLGPFYINPETQLPWSAADIIAFQPGGSYALAMDFLATSSVHISSIEMVVNWIPEKRVAWGAAVPSGYDSTGSIQPNVNRDDVPFVLQHNDTAGSDFLKLVSTDYLVVMHKLPYFDAAQPNVVNAAAAVGYVEAVKENPSRQGQGMDVTILPNGRLRTVGSLNRRMFEILMVKADASTSVDSQPYSGIDQLAASAVISSRQTFTSPDARTFGTIRLQLGYFVSLAPTAAVTIQIRRSSDNVAMGSAATVTFAQLIANFGSAKSWARQDFPVRTYDVLLQLTTPATLAASTAYYIEMTSTSTNPWLMNYLMGELPVGLTGDRTVAGNAVYGGSPVAGDLLLTVVDKPTPITTFTATLGTDAIADPGAVDCSLGTLPKVTLAWSTTALSTLFDSYEIQRDDGAGFQTIRRVRNEGTLSWVDRDMNRNVAVSYRIRVTRTDGGISDWATASSVTPVQAVNTLHLVSPHVDVAMGFLELGGLASWMFPTSAQAEWRDLYARDFEAEVRPTERKGVQFSARLLIWMGGDLTTAPPGGPGRRAFAPLRSLVERLGLPYITVLSPDGEKVYASVVMPAPSTRDNPAHMYVATVAVREVADVPVPLDV